MVLFQALGLTLFLTSLSKVFFGRQRPNFFAFCDYKGYRNAVATGDFTEYPRAFNWVEFICDSGSYFARTVPGVQGSIEFCEATPGEINESMFSHPSGHASLSFAGLGFLSLFLHHMLLSHRPTKRHHVCALFMNSFRKSYAGCSYGKLLCFAYQCLLPLWLLLQEHEITGTTTMIQSWVLCWDSDALAWHSTSITPGELPTTSNMSVSSIRNLKGGYFENLELGE